MNRDCVKETLTKPDLVKRMSTELTQIAERARKHQGQALTNLHQFIDARTLEDSLLRLNRVSSPGVDQQDWASYNEERSMRIPELLSRFKSGTYKAPPIRRVYIPKGKGGQRPLGIPTIEDKVLQESVRRILEPIYEVDFKPFSFGFRKGYSAHQAVEYMFNKVSFEGMHYIIDADIKNYFGSINHGQLREFLDLRVKDGVVRKMIDKWLKAGILEEGQLSYPKEGTPQGGVISPLLSNIYLHYVLDAWFSEEIQPRLKGRSFIVRYADDFVLGFEEAGDVSRVMRVLPKRFKKFNLELHPTKTQIINLDNNRGEGQRSFDFLGFTHYLGKSRKGYLVLKRKTSKTKFTLSLSKIRDWIRQNRHRPLKELIVLLNSKLRGHYSYYGITFNSRCIGKFHKEVERTLFKWLNRRGGKRSWPWERYEKLVNEWIPLLRPRIYHSFLPAKPS